MSRLVRRNRGSFISAALILLAILVGAGLSVWQAVAARRAEARADARSAMARTAVDDMYTKVAKEWLTEEGELSDLQKEFLEKALQFYEALSEEESDDPELRYEALKALFRVADLRNGLGQAEQAGIAYESLIAQCEQPTDDAELQLVCRILRIDAQAALAQVLRLKGLAIDANAVARDAFQAFEQLPNSERFTERCRMDLAHATGGLVRELIAAHLPQESGRAAAVCLEQRRILAAAHPESFDHRLALAHAHFAQGTQLMWWGHQNEQSIAAFELADLNFAALLTERPGHRLCRQFRASTLGNLAIVFGRLGKSEEELAYFRRGVALEDQLHRDFPDDPGLQISLIQSLGNLATCLRHTDEALECVKKAWELSGNLVDRFPDVVSYRTEYVKNSQRLFWEHFVRRQPDEASDILSQGLRKCDGYTFQSPVTGERATLRSMLAVTIAVKAEFEIEHGDHAEAAATLAQIPLAARTAADLTVNQEEIDAILHERGVEEAQLEALDQFEGTILTLGRPAFLYRECARISHDDQSLPLVERADASEGYEALARIYEDEVQRAVEAWLESLRSSNAFNQLKSEYLSNWCERRLASLEEKSPLPAEQRFIESHECAMCKRFIREVVGRHPDENSLLLVGYLTAGPIELRDTELALAVSRLGVETFPDDQVAWRNLAWALFRNGRFQDCLDLYDEHGINRKSDAIVAMALWQVGRREEAAAMLGDEYETALADYLERASQGRKERGVHLYPTPVMLRQLDREAKAMILADRAAQ